MAVRPVPQELPANQTERVADPAATWNLLATVRDRVDELRRRRFAGEDPVVTIETAKKARVARSTLLRDAVVATLVAERLGALLQLDDTLLTPAEDLAVDELVSAYRSLATWDLRAAESALARAVRFARLPEQQQRVALGWALHRLVADLLWLVPGDAKTLPAERLVLDLMPTLDRLPDEERRFYAGEVRRLAAAWREAGNDDHAWCVWALLRARVALLRNEGVETALAWLLRLARRAGLVVAGDDPDGLMTLLRRAEAVFQLLAQPPVDPASAEELRTMASQASPRDLFRALVAALTARWGEDALAATHRFALALWVPESPSST
ncbi:MAG: hypothetical protein RMK01_11705 [Thermomicrobium sp.]|nr:hypothetical protein [Thermomicrobium sp.]